MEHRGYEQVAVMEERRKDLLREAHQRRLVRNEDPVHSNRVARLFQHFTRPTRQIGSQPSVALDLAKE